MTSPNITSEISTSDKHTASLRYYITSMRPIALTIFLLFSTLCLSATYSEALAARMVNISSAIYFIDTYEQVQSNQCPTCYKQLRIDTVKRGYGFVFLIGVDPTIKAIVVAFRGTDNLKNWVLDDFRISKRDLDEIPSCRGCKTHQGFFKAYNTIQNKLGVDISVEVRQYTDDPHLFHGHSLGGALANLGALFAADRSGYSLPIVVYTFGQPRVGNSEYAEFYDQKIPNNFRVIHRTDWIPHKPMMLLGYVHSGYELWYENGMKEPYKMCHGDSDDCSNSISFWRFSDLINHFDNGYTELKINESSESARLQANHATSEL